MTGSFHSKLIALHLVFPQIAISAQSASSAFVANCEFCVNYARRTSINTTWPVISSVGARRKLIRGGHGALVTINVLNVQNANLDFVSFARRSRTSISSSSLVLEQFVLDVRLSKAVSRTDRRLRRILKEPELDAQASSAMMIREAFASPSTSSLRTLHTISF